MLQKITDRTVHRKVYRSALFFSLLNWNLANSVMLNILYFLKIFRLSNPIQLNCYLRYIAFCTAYINPFLSKGFYHLHQHTSLIGFGNLVPYQSNPHPFSPTQSKCGQKNVAPNVLYWKEVKTKSALDFRLLAIRYSTTLMVFCCYFY